MHRVRIYVQVPQAFTARPPAGDEGDLRMPQYPGQQFDAKLVKTSNAIDQATRSMQVELQADNSKASCTAARIAGSTSRSRGDPNMVGLPATALISGKPRHASRRPRRRQQSRPQGHPARTRFGEQCRGTWRALPAGQGDRQSTRDIAKWRPGPAGCSKAGVSADGRSRAVGEFLAITLWVSLSRFATRDAAELTRK